MPRKIGKISRSDGRHFCARFNEAAAVMPRKMSGGVKDTDAGESFNEAAAVMPRKILVRLDVTGRVLASFNEAAAVMPRKIFGKQEDPQPSKQRLQ